MPAMWMAGGAAVGAAGNIFSSIFGSSASKAQADAIRYSADKASQTALDLNDKARADVAPFRQLGVDAGNQLSDIISGKKTLDDATMGSSLFQWEQTQGTRDLTRQLASQGLSNSGAGLEALARFNAQLVGEQGQNYFQNLFNLTQLGGNAAAQQATNTTQTGNNVANLQANAGMAAGQATANSINAIGSLGTGIAQPFQTAGTNYMQYQMYKPFFDSFNKQPSNGGVDWTTNNTGVLPENQLSTFS